MKNENYTECWPTPDGIEMSLAAISIWVKGRSHFYTTSVWCRLSDGVHIVFDPQGAPVFESPNKDEAIAAAMLLSGKVTGGDL